MIGAMAMPCGALPFMGYVRGQDREQSALFPVSLDELIGADHLCRVIEAFVRSLDLQSLGLARTRSQGPMTRPTCWGCTCTGTAPARRHLRLRSDFRNKTPRSGDSGALRGDLRNLF